MIWCMAVTKAPQLKDAPRWLLIQMIKRYKGLYEIENRGRKELWERLKKYERQEVRNAN